MDRAASLFPLKAAAWKQSKLSGDEKALCVRVCVCVCVCVTLTEGKRDRVTDQWESCREGKRESVREN